MGHKLKFRSRSLYRALLETPLVQCESLCGERCKIPSKEIIQETPLKFEATLLNKEDRFLPTGLLPIALPKRENHDLDDCPKHSMAPTEIYKHLKPCLQNIILAAYKLKVSIAIFIDCLIRRIQETVFVRYRTQYEFIDLPFDQRTLLAILNSDS